MNEQKVRRGIGTYEHEIEVIQRLLRRRGEMSSDQFDSIFYGARPKNRPPPLHGDSFDLANMHPHRDLALQILRFLVNRGHVSAEWRDGRVYYKLKA